MLLYPAMKDLLKHINSRYLLVNVVAHRAVRLPMRRKRPRRRWMTSR